MEENEYFLDSFICELKSTEKYEAIHELIDKSPVFKKITDRKLFESEVVKREHRQSTGFGRGIAVTHGHGNIGSILIALGVSCEGIEYDAMDNKPVNLMFMIANPPDQQCEYLRILSALVKLLRKPDFRSDILACKVVKEQETLIREAFMHQLSEEKYCTATA